MRWTLAVWSKCGYMSKPIRRGGEDMGRQMPPIWTNEPRHEKTNVLVSDLVRHKPGCTATEDGLRLEISDLESIRIVLSI